MRAAVIQKTSAIDLSVEVYAGNTTTVMQEYLGIPNPCAGGIFDATVYRGHAVVGHDEYQHVGVECEIAVRLGSDLPTAGAPYYADSVAPAVDAVMAAIEIVDDRWLDYTSVDTPTLIAAPCTITICGICG